MKKHLTKITEDFVAAEGRQFHSFRLRLKEAMRKCRG